MEETIDWLSEDGDSRLLRLTSIRECLESGSVTGGSLLPFSLPELIYHCCYASSSSRVEMHLCQSILLTALRHSLLPEEDVIRSLVSECTISEQWDRHFLIRLLATLKQMGSTLQPPLLCWCIERVSSAPMEKGCVCHVLERILRIGESLDEHASHMDLSQSLLSYLSSHRKELACVYKHKVVYHSMSYLNDAAMRQLVAILASEDSQQNPYFILSCYQLAFTLRDETVLQRVHALIPQDVSCQEILQYMGEKDTLFLSFMSVFSALALQSGNAHSFYSMFSAFIVHYDYDAGLIVAFLNESSETLSLLLNTCKLIKEDRDVGRESTEWLIIVDYLKSVYTILQEGEHRGVFLFSVQPLLKRIECSIPRYSVSWIEYSSSCWQSQQGSLHTPLSYRLESVVASVIP